MWENRKNGIIPLSEIHTKKVRCKGRGNVHINRFKPSFLRRKHKISIIIAAITKKYIKIYVFVYLAIFQMKLMFFCIGIGDIIFYNMNGVGVAYVFLYSFLVTTA